MTAALKLVDNKTKVYRSNKPVLALRFDYLHVTGKTDIHAGMVLSQLVYLYQKDVQSKVKDITVKDNEGVFWKKMTHIDWTETMGLTRQQSRSATKKLEACGFIETKSMLYGRDKCLHYRLVCAEGDACIDGYPEFKPPSGLQETMAVVTGNQPLTTLDKTLVDKPKTESLSAKAENPPGETKPEPQQGKQNMKLEDVLKKQNEKTVLNGRPLRIIWAEMMGEVMGITCPPLDKVKQKIINDIVSKIGGDKARELLLFVVPHWSEYVAAVQEKENHKLGSQPNLFDLRAHYPIALQLIAKPAPAKKPIKWAKAASNKDKP
jgi:hypothetical protein